MARGDGRGMVEALAELTRRRSHCASGDGEISD
jgi:hypothetical protein